MVCDHLASVFFAPDASIYIILRLIGRITAPSMCLALAEGFVHTHLCGNRTDTILVLRVGNLHPATWQCAIYICMLICLDGGCRELEEDWHIKGYYRCHRTTCTVDEDRLAYIRTSVHTVDLYEQRK